jgi:DNA-binding response OmpR family regulator
MSNEQCYEIIKNVRKNKKFAKLPIIVLGSKELEQSRNKCLDLGANDCLDKPFQDANLLAIMKVWIT